MVDTAHIRKMFDCFDVILEGLVWIDTPIDECNSMPLDWAINAHMCFTKKQWLSCASIKRQLASCESGEEGCECDCQTLHKRAQH